MNNVGKQQNVINFSEAGKNFTETYPDSNAAKSHTERLLKEMDYCVFGVANPIEIAPEIYEKHRKEIETYLSLCERLTQAYTTNPRVRSYIRAALLQFEPHEIQQLAEAEKIHFLTGAQYASDIVNHKTVEVNIGPVGGIPELAASQQLLPEAVFPFSNDLLYGHIAHSICDYYERFCAFHKITPKPVSERQLCYVENDGIYPGSFSLVQNLQSLGLNITITPKEALHFDEQSNTLYVNNGDLHTQIDQIILDYHLQDGPNDHVSQAIHCHAVATESTLLAPIVLGSKATMAILYNACTSQKHPLLRELNITPEEAQIIQGMFPDTYIFSTKTCRKLNINGLCLTESLGRLNMYAKVTTGGNYGGRGNYDLDKPSELKRFITELRRFVINNIRIRTEIPESYDLFSSNNLFRTFVSQSFIANLKEHLHETSSSPIQEIFTPNQELTKHGQRVDQLFSLLSSTTNPAINTFEEDINGKITAIHNLIHGNSRLLDNSEIKQFFNNLAYLINFITGRSLSQKEVGALGNRLVDYLATRLVTPILLQQKIVPNGAELRAAGTIGKSSTTFTLQAGRFGNKNEPPKIIAPISVSNMQPFYTSETDAADSLTLETELEAPISSTAMDLSLIKPDEEITHSLVLMSGTGRHARYISQSSTIVTGVDLSEMYVNHAKKITPQQNIQFIAADALEFLRSTTDHYDLVSISGNSLIYLPPAQQKDLLTLIQQRLTTHGSVIFDITDLEKYQEILQQKGNIGITSEGTNHRMVKRRLVLAENSQYGTLEDLTMYFTAERENVHSGAIYYLPHIATIREYLQSAGFTQIDIQKIVDPYFGGMMYQRYLIRAFK